MEKIYIVDGWDGDMEVFHSEENARKELNRRVLLADDCVLEVEREKYLEYRWYDKTIKDNYFLVFMEVEFSD